MRDNDAILHVLYEKAGKQTEKKQMMYDVLLD